MFKNGIRYPKILIIGSSYSGKSWLVRNIIYNMYKNYIHMIDKISIVDTTKESENFYKDIVDSQYIHTKYDCSISKNILNNHENNLFIIDSSDYDEQNVFNFDVNLHKIMTQHNVIFIMTTCNGSNITPEVRLKYDYVFVLDVSNKRNMT